MTSATPLQRLLEELGLPMHSIRVLQYLLAHPETKAAEVIRSLGTHKQLVYLALRDLETRRLIRCFVRNGVRWYQVLNGDVLVEEASQKSEAAAQAAQLIHREKRQTPSSGMVQIFEGVEGIHSFTDLVLNEAPSLDILSGNVRFLTLYPEIFDTWNQRREEKGIRLRVLVPKGVSQDLLIKTPKYDYRKFDAGLFPGVLWIFGDSIAHVLWIDKRSSQVILIRNAPLAQQQRDLFKYLWRRNG